MIDILFTKFCSFVVTMYTSKYILLDPSLAKKVITNISFKAHQLIIDGQHFDFVSIQDPPLPLLTSYLQKIESKIFNVICVTQNICEFISNGFMFC